MKKIIQPFFTFITIAALAFLISCGSDESAKAAQNKPSPSVSAQSIQSGFAPIEQGKLFYQRMGKGAPVIVIHGGPGLDQNYLQPQMQELAKNYDVIFYDQRGSGKSLDTPINSQTINVDKFVADLEDLRKELKLEKFTILGHSWGCFVGLNYAIQHPDRVKAIALMSPSPVNYKGLQAFIDEFMKKFVPYKDKIKPIFDKAEFAKLNSQQISDLYRTMFTIYFADPVKVKDLSVNMDAVAAKSGVKVDNKMGDTFWRNKDLDLLPQLKKVAIPTFIIHGKQDLVPVWTVQEIQAAIPNAQLLLLDDCGHFPYVEQPVATFAALNSFINSHAKCKKCH